MCCDPITEDGENYFCSQCNQPLDKPKTTPPVKPEAREWTLRFYGGSNDFDQSPRPFIVQETGPIHDWKFGDELRVIDRSALEAAEKRVVELEATVVRKTDSLIELKEERNALTSENARLRDTLNNLKTPLLTHEMDTAGRSHCLDLIDKALELEKNSI